MLQVSLERKEDTIPPWIHKYALAGQLPTSKEQPYQIYEKPFHSISATFCNSYKAISALHIEPGQAS